MKLVLTGYHFDGENCYESFVIFEYESLEKANEDFDGIKLFNTLAKEEYDKQMDIYRKRLDHTKNNRDKLLDLAKSRPTVTLKTFCGFVGFVKGSTEYNILPFEEWEQSNKFTGSIIGTTTGF